jgi:hypothetical protein
MLKMIWERKMQNRYAPHVRDQHPDVFVKAPIVTFCLHNERYSIGATYHLASGFWAGKHAEPPPKFSASKRDRSPVSANLSDGNPWKMVSTFEVIVSSSSIDEFICWR